MDNKKAKMRKLLKEVIKYLNETKSLDFEYLGPSGEEDISKAINFSIFKRLDIARFVAKFQTSGSRFGIYLIAKILEKNHMPYYLVHIPNSLKELYEAFEDVNLPIKYFDKIEDLQLGFGDFLIFDEALLKAYLEKHTFEEINKKQVVLMISVDQINIEEIDKPKIKNLDDCIFYGLKHISCPFNNLDSYVLNIDTGKIFGFEGLNTGHLFFKFNDPKTASDYERDLTIIVRVTISTPTKLGVDMLRVLLWEDCFSKKMANIIIQ